MQLIWFEPGYDAHLYKPSELRAEVELVPVVEREDGVIYEVGRVGPSSHDC